MSLPQIKLDDRHFQELVSEARLRIAQSCPEWTEHNVSDPGITLIELFAWMTDMLIYRVNRVPDKLHVALLELLGIELHGPTAARTNVRFRLAAPPDQSVEIPAGTHRSRDAADGIRRVGRVPSRGGFLDPAAEAGGLCRRAGRPVQDDRGGGWCGQAAGSGPLSVRDAAPGQRCALPGLRGRPGEPVGPSRYRRPGRARRGSRPGGSAAAVGGQPGGRWLGGGGRARRPDRRLQLRRRRDRAAMSGGIRSCGHRR